MANPRRDSFGQEKWLLETSKQASSAAGTEAKSAGRRKRRLAHVPVTPLDGWQTQIRTAQSSIPRTATFRDAGSENHTSQDPAQGHPVPAAVRDFGTKGMHRPLWPGMASLHGPSRELGRMAKGQGGVRKTFPVASLARSNLEEWAMPARSRAIIPGGCLGAGTAPNPLLEAGPLCLSEPPSVLPRAAHPPPFPASSSSSPSSPSCCSLSVPSFRAHSAEQLSPGLHHRLTHSLSPGHHSLMQQLPRSLLKAGALEQRV